MMLFGITSKLHQRFSNTLIVSIICLLVPSASSLGAVEQKPEVFNTVGVTEKIGEKVPLDLTFKNEKGELVRLQDLVSNKPVLVSLVYYSCPMLCNLIVTGMTTAYETLPMTAGKDFQSISISIDPRDTTETAEKFKQKYISQLSDVKPNTEWSFLLDDNGSVDALADALGYRYEFNEKTQEYAHTATIFVLTPDGTISRYLYGIEYPPFNLRMALIEAAENKTHSTVERVLLFCYNYDPNSGGYVLYAVNLMKVAAFITVLAILTMFIVLKRKERN